jgi:glutamine synthetase
MERGMLDQKTVAERIREDEIDTVLMVFPDQQGRFMGKRLTGRYFLEDVLEGGEGAIHACNYLLAVDMEMEPIPGYAYANWDTGYGDLAMRPDMSTLRNVPWLEKTALVICDVFDEESGEPVARSSSARSNAPTRPATR